MLKYVALVVVLVCGGCALGPRYHEVKPGEWIVCQQRFAYAGILTVYVWEDDCQPVPLRDRVPAT